MDETKKIKREDITNEAIALLASKLPKSYGEPKMFVITFMIHTRLSENTMAQLTDKFVNSIPSEDWSKNMMICYTDKLADKEGIKG